MNDNNNIASIKAVYTALEELGGTVVFVGGAVVSLYRERPAAEVRPTDDVDIVIELASYAEYATIEEQLRKKGFLNDNTSEVICRYIVNGVLVDVMPTNDEILGFSNKWYANGFKDAIDYVLDENTIVKILRADYFIASKFEAFYNRGNDDGRTSTDFEDIVYLLNNRNSIWQEIKAAPKEVRAFLYSSFKRIIDEGNIYEWISVHLEHSEQKRTDFIVGGLYEFVG